jgi:hypothetical protein
LASLLVNCAILPQNLAEPQPLQPQKPQERQTIWEWFDEDTWSSDSKNYKSGDSPGELESCRVESITSSELKGLKKENEK